METTPVRILLIDDDEEQFVIVQRYLKRAKAGTYEIEWVSSFEAALESASDDLHDLCLLDYQLGARTGIELLGELRAKGLTFPVILLTGQGSYELDLDAMGRGVSDFLDKNDLNPILLERSIRYTVENHRARVALKRMNEELEERVRERTAELNKSNQELEQFANVVARDLQTPLRALQEQVLRVRDRESGEGAVAHRLLDPVLHATQNIELLVRSVLDHARAGRGSAAKENVGLNEVALEAWTKLEASAAELGAELDAGDLPALPGNRNQLLGLFENMFDNALKYHGDAAPRITVSAERQDNQWRIDISDNGAGIGEEDSEEIFLMFSRLRSEETCEGVGIGLAICRKIVKHHGGRLWFDSEPGEGTTFHLLLPAG